MLSILGCLGLVIARLGWLSGVVFRKSSVVPFVVGDLTKLFRLEWSILEALIRPGVIWASLAATMSSSESSVGELTPRGL